MADCSRFLDNPSTPAQYDIASFLAPGDDSYLLPVRRAFIGSWQARDGADFLGRERDGLIHRPPPGQAVFDQHLELLRHAGVLRYGWTGSGSFQQGNRPGQEAIFIRVQRFCHGDARWDVTGDLDIDRRLLAAVTGVEMSRKALTRVAERAFTLERVMLARAGRNRAMEQALAPHFRLPCRADGTSIDAAGFARLLDEYYAARGWDLELGWPTAETLRRLELDEAIPEVAALRAQAARQGRSAGSS